MAALYIVVASQPAPKAQGWGNERWFSCRKFSTQRQPFKTLVFPHLSGTVEILKLDYLDIFMPRLCFCNFHTIKLHLMNLCWFWLPFCLPRHVVLYSLYNRELWNRSKHPNFPVFLKNKQFAIYKTPCNVIKTTWRGRQNGSQNQHKFIKFSLIVWKLQVHKRGMKMSREYNLWLPTV